MTEKESDTKTEASPLKTSSEEDKPSSLFKNIEVEISFFETFTLVMSILAMLEVGFFFTTIACMVLSTVAFAEMMQLQANRAKEDKISIKTSYVDWCFYFSFQFFITTKTWLN